MTARRFVLELLRAGTSGLTLLGMTGGFESDVLVGAGRVRRVRTCYFGLEGIGLAPMFTEAAQRGDIEVVEESEASIAWGVRAALAGVGYMPSNAWQGTDMFKARPDVRTVHCPYTGQELAAFPSLRPDVIVVHTPVADVAGNTELLAVANSFEDAEMGWVGTLGVRRPWRKRGLGLALLRHSFNEFYRRDKRKVGLGVDAQNLTGALRLYESAGMHIDLAHDFYEKELRPGREISVQSLAD